MKGLGKMNAIIEIINQEVIYPGFMSEEDETLITRFLQLVPDSYVLIPWPEVQELMDEDWFKKEAILDIDSTVGDSSYFIPLKRIL